MKKYLILICLSFCAVQLKAQQGCSTLEQAAPSTKKYKKYLMMQKGCDPANTFVANFTCGKSEDEFQMMGFMLTDDRKNRTRIDVIKSNADDARQSKNKQALRLSKIQLGKNAFVGHTLNTATPTNWHFTTILNDGYIVELVMTNKELHTLDDFENYISGYLSQIVQTNLKK